MTNRHRRAPLPARVHYTRHNGGMYVHWNGRPEGQVTYTFDADTARDEDGEFPWVTTPYQGADGSCRLSRVLRLAAEYAA